MPIYDYSILADYHQFYLVDDDVEPMIPEYVTDDHRRRRVMVAPHVMVIYPARKMRVPVTVEIDDAEPSSDLTAWDHVAECSLEISSGRIVIAGCTDYLPECARLHVAPGTYRARVHFRGLDAPGVHGLDVNDHYLISLWRAPAGELRILKQYEEAAA